MSAALFDPDDIMREVRAKANLSPAAKSANLLMDDNLGRAATAKTANPLKRGVDFSSLAVLAAPTGISRKPDEPAANLPDGWRGSLHEFLFRPCPEDARAEHWACACRGVQQFERGWAAKAMSLGWTFDELFELKDPFANVSLQGAAWFVGDSTVTAVTADAITLRTEGGATQRIYRRLRG